MPAYANPPDPTFQRAIELWKAHARAFLGEAGKGPDVPVYYNRWFLSPAYRARIADRLGIRNSDAGLDVVPHHGRGSSFDGLDYAGRATQMDVMSRVDQLTGQERAFLSIVEQDPEVRVLYERVEAATAM